MSVKATVIKPTVAKANQSAKTGNGRSVQRKTAFSPLMTASVQRKENAGHWMHGRPLKAAGSHPLIQPKYNVHASDDRFEKEADNAADKAVSQEKNVSPVKVSSIKSGVQRKCANCEKEEAAVQARHIQKKCSTCGDAEQVQAKGNKNQRTHSLHSSDSSPPVVHENTTSQALDRALGNTSARGSPLPQATREDMEHRMGADFSNVRIHTGPVSHEASNSIGARAFTSGGNIHFANDQFDPQSKNGKHLLAHELAHTMQQGAAPAKNIQSDSAVTKGLRKIVPKPKFEKKLAGVDSPYKNQSSSRKNTEEEFSKKLKKGKTKKLSGEALKKDKGKRPGKDPPVLPGKEKKKQDKPAKPPVKAPHLQSAKNQQAQLNQLASAGINFKPHPDKASEDDPAQKKQSQQSKKISESVLNRAAESASVIHSSITRIRPRLMVASSLAIGRIKANEAAQKEKIKTEIKEQKGAAKKAMQQAAGSVSGYHKKVTGEIKTAAAKAKADILMAKVLNTVLIEVAAITQVPKIDKAYSDAKKDFEASGNSVGSSCYSSQSQRKNSFYSQLKYEDDSLLDGPYTDDMKRARGDAALKVGEGYRDSMIEAGKEQAAGIDKGKPNDLKKVDDAKAEMLKGLNDMYDNSLKGIEAAEKAGLSQADSTKKSMLGSIYKQHKTAQSQLDTTEKTQLQMAEILSLKQSQQVELQAAQAIDAMEEGGAQNLVQLNNGFKEYKQVCESMNSPPPGMLQQKLQPIEASLAQSAPAMAASLQKGMLQTENGFQKTASETISATNTTVTQTLADSKITNDKAIEGLKKLQSAGVTALQGILNNNKKTITETASQCVTNIQAIKSAFDSALTSIQSDLTSGLKTGSVQLKEGLQSAVNNGTADNGNKGMLAYSQEQEQEAADKVEPRWKSVVKVLIVIAVILVVALVVGPAVIGFIGAAAGGGAFGTAVGAVVGGAILGAGSSAVITVSNNLLDGKKWNTGLKEAMIEGAVTGAIGGAFGAAGSGIAGKLIGVAAKGVGPALGRFAISQTVDFAGNIATEYVSSKLQGKPFSWTAVAQGQAIGAGMHIGMGGLSSLKNVKGFKTINAISEGAGNLGSKFGSKAKAKFSTPEPAAPPKTTAEEPHSKGPPSKDEPTPASKTTEETKTAPKEEGPAAKPKEEAPSAAPKDEPAAAKPAEEPKPAPKETEPVKVKDEPATSKAVTEEKKPSNLTQEEINDGIAAKHPTEDGHNMKVTDKGMLVKCSTCEIVDFHNNPYKKDLPKAKQEQFGKEWDAIQKETNPDIKAKKAAEFDAKLNKELDNHLKEGSKAAKKLGLPPAEEGYHWKSNGEGDPIYSNNPNNPGKPRVFDKEKGIFVDADTKPAPKPDIEAKYKTDAQGKPVAESLDTSKATSKEAAEVKKTHEERAAIKEDKEKLSKGTDEYNEKNKEMIDKSEKMGEASADAYMKEKYGLEPEFTGSGSRTVDKVYVGKDGKVYVVEAKGGSSGLGTKVSTDGSTKGKVLQQGSKEYLEQTVKEMKASGDPKKVEAAKKIETAMKEGDLVYLHVSQKVGPNGELVPATIKEFNID